MTYWQILLTASGILVAYLSLVSFTYRYCEGWDIGEEQLPISAPLVAFWFATVFPMVYWPMRWSAIGAEKLVMRRRAKQKKATTP